MSVTKGTIGDFSSEQLFEEFMRRFGIDTRSEHFRDTPKRVVKMYEELLRGHKEVDFKITTFEAPEDSGLVTISDLNFYSLCSHHLMVFHGKCHIGYLPDKKIA